MGGEIFTIQGSTKVDLRKKQNNHDTLEGAGEPKAINYVTEERSRWLKQRPSYIPEVHNTMYIVSVRFIYWA